MVYVGCVRASMNCEQTLLWAVVCSNCFVYHLQNRVSRFLPIGSFVQIVHRCEGGMQYLCSAVFRSLYIFFGEVTCESRVSICNNAFG